MKVQITHPINCDHNFVKSPRTISSKALPTQATMESSKSDLKNENVSNKKTSLYLNKNYLQNSIASLQGDTKKSKFSTLSVSSGIKYYLPEKNSALLKEKHQKRKKNTLVLITNLQQFSNKPKEKIMLSNVFKNSIGPARNLESVKFKYLLSSNYEKISTNYFYKENEDFKDFIQQMKTEGFIM